MNKNLSRGALYLALSSLGLMFAGYIVNIYLGRTLGPTGYGIYGIVISLMTAANLMQTAGLPQAVSKFVAEDEESAENILKSSLVIQIISTLLLTIIFILLSKVIASLLRDDTLIPYIVLASLIFPLYGVFSLYTGYYNGLHNFSKQSILNILYAFLKIISVLVFVYFFHLYGAIIGFIVAPLLALIYGIYFPKVGIKSYPYKKLILFAIPLVGFAIFSNLLQSVDLFFVKALMHVNKETGYYTANQNIAEIPFFIITALAGVLLPSISRRVKLNAEEHTKNLIKKSLRLSSLLLIPSVFLISATSLQLLTLFYSFQYKQGAVSLSILVFANGFFTLFTILAIIISGSGAPFKSSFLAALGVIISSFLCLFFIPLYGLNGAAFSTTTAAFIVMICAAIIVYRKFGVLFSFKSLVKIVFISLLLYMLSRLIIFPTLLLPLFYIIFYGLYVLFLFLLKEITQDDIKIVKELIPSWLMTKFKQ